jgi:NitT/TauT family transport system substrate-binding protein
MMAAVRLKLALATLALLTGCGGLGPAGSQPPSAAGTPAAPARQSTAVSPAANLPKITIAVSLNPSDLPLWIADDTGIFARNGIAVTIAPITGGTTGTAALLAGEVQMGAGGGAEIMSASSSGADLVIVATFTPVYDWFLEASSKVKSPEDLKGRAIAVSAVGGSAGVAGRVAVRQLGLRDTDVTLRGLGSQANVVAALASQAVDGAMVQSPSNRLLEAQGAHMLLNLAATKAPAAQTTIYLQRSFATSQHDVVQRFMDSIVQAIARLKGDRAIAIETLKTHMKVEDIDGLNTTYDFYAGEVLPSLPYPKPEQFNDTLTLLAESNPKLQGFDVSKLLDPSFVQSAADRGLDRR